MKNNNELILKIENFQRLDIKNDKSRQHYNPCYDVTVIDGEDYLYGDEANLAWDNIIGTQFDLSKLRKKIEKNLRGIDYNDGCYYFGLPCIRYYNDFYIKIKKSGKGFTVCDSGTSILI